MEGFKSWCDKAEVKIGKTENRSAKNKKTKKNPDQRSERKRKFLKINK